MLTGMDISTVVGLRDRAIIAVMTYTFARVGAVVALSVEDYFAEETLVAPAGYFAQGATGHPPFGLWQCFHWKTCRAMHRRIISPMA